MGIFLIYILKSAVCLSLFYLFYRLLLSKETFHRFNRIALLGILFLSLLIPFIEVTTAHQTELSQTVLTVEQLLMMAEAMDPAEVSVAQPEELSISWVQVLLLFYLVGIIFFACRNLYSLSRLLLLIKSGKRERLKGGVRLIVLEREVAPFSWMRYIVISRKDLEEDGREILIHEMAHIQNRHSIDLLVADICIFFQWFNPGIWLLKQELQNIHEYEADETVINEGIDAKDYQLLLIKKAVGTRLYSMANSFNHSKLKKRITMMLKEKSNPWARLKYLYVLPLAAIAVTAFARPEISEKADEISAVKVNDLAAIVEAKVEEITKDVSNITSGDSLKKLVVTGDSILKEKGTISIYGEKGKNGVLATKLLPDEDNHFKITKTQAKIKPGMNTSVDKSKLMGTHIGGISTVDLRDKDVLVIIDGKESSRTVVDALDPSRIESISILDGKEATDIYGDKAKNGAMVIQLHSTAEQILQNKYKIDAISKTRLDALNCGSKNWGVTFHSVSGKKPLVYIDGKEAVGEEALSSVSPERIKSISVMKDKAAVEVYGERGKDGVVLVDLLTEEEYQNKQKFPKPAKVRTESESPKKSHFYMGGSHDEEWHVAQAKKKPLVIIDGKEALEEDAISKLAPDRIKNFTILKDKSATDIYGERGKNGVLIITLFTDAEYEFNKANPKKPYADALELAESMAKDVEGEIIYCIDDEKIKKSKLKGMSTKNIRSVSVNEMDGTKIVRLETDKYRSDWISVTGVVTDEEGKTIAATVLVKGTNDYTVADADGRFNLKAPKNGILRIADVNKSVAEVKVKPMLKVVLKDK
ncbi:M56 family peptidase [Bacteroides thetaiotaomicron]|uniref:M56 family metallopeptidase n=1 Tax=Bacteroides thetaiotaomicron TaxID=818 RepID=UPI001D08EDCB|nr:M56 family metallopeptidase [Bacteroides thetaiotaomicron]MCB7313388.1 M56 family peptidase [Bacteroides thetaiotaomicron]MCB7419057.1 M56 family peptidase [Bacteroides thetaiotaomicron]MCB7442746.1 M56 family peptidase [Bacteroides thetaiotaomicron]MCG5006309.1 M56 family peptidase [Bacteroides thetaiotaomicron]